MYACVIAALCIAPHYTDTHRYTDTQTEWERETHTYVCVCLWVSEGVSEWVSVCVCVCVCVCVRARARVCACVCWYTHTCTDTEEPRRTDKQNTKHKIHKTAKGRWSRADKDRQRQTKTHKDTQRHTKTHASIATISLGFFFYLISLGFFLLFEEKTQSYTDTRQHCHNHIHIHIYIYKYIYKYIHYTRRLQPSVYMYKDTRQHCHNQRKEKTQTKCPETHIIAKGKCPRTDKDTHQTRHRHTSHQTKTHIRIAIREHIL